MAHNKHTQRTYNVKKKYLVFFTTFALLVILDFLTKAYISSTMFLHDSFPVINGFFNITYVKNPGAAFSFLADAPAAFRSIFFITVTSLAILCILYYIVKDTFEDPFMIYGLSLIMSGAVGNLIDRVRQGEVVDFIDLYIGSYHWPAFNVADSAITVGAFLLLLEIFRGKKKLVSSASA